MFKVVFDEVIHDLKSGEEKTYTVGIYGVEGIYGIRDLFVNSDHLRGYIIVLEDIFLISITIRRL